MRLLGNVLWVLFGGALLGFLWCVAGILCCITIVYIPIGVQCFKFARFTIWPFGKRILFSNSFGSFLLNVVWILVFGWELTIASLIIGAVWCITIIGIPFGVQCFKFARMALFPFGCRIIKI